MKILVTGGAGFIGSSVVKAALAKGHEVVNVDSLTYAACLASLEDVADDPRYAFEQVDICDRPALNRVFDTHQPDAVMHLAAESHVDRSIDGPETFVQTNVMGTFHMLDAARALWEKNGRPDTFRFHHISTDEVFGSLGPDPETDGQFTEDTPYDPRSPYSASKAASDHLVRAWHETYGLPVVLTNCSNNYGPYHFPEKLVPVVILNALAGRAIPVYGAGENVRDWLYVEDHARGLALSLVKGKAGETYNIGGKNEMKNIDVVRALISIVHGLKPELKTDSPDDMITYVKDRPGHDKRYAINCEKIEKELGWSPRESFETGMAKTVQWYLENEAWIKAIEDGTYAGERLGQSA